MPGAPSSFLFQTREISEISARLETEVALLRAREGLSTCLWLPEVAWQVPWSSKVDVIWQAVQLATRKGRKKRRVKKVNKETRHVKGQRVITSKTFRGRSRVAQTLQVLRALLWSFVLHTHKSPRNGLMRPSVRLRCAPQQLAEVKVTSFHFFSILYLYHTLQV